MAGMVVGVGGQVKGILDWRGVRAKSRFLPFASLRVGMTRKNSNGATDRYDMLRSELLAWTVSGSESVW